MTKQEQLLVPLDGSALAEAAPPFAEALARTRGATLHLFAVIEREPGGPFSLAPEVRDQIQRRQEEGLADYLTAIAGRCRVQGLTVDTETVVGEPAEEILAAAERSGAAMIVMATHGRGGLQRLFLGSVADKVMRMASCATLLVSPSACEGPSNRQSVTLRRIAVPLDGSPLAETALPTATALATAAGARLVLVRMQSLPVTTTMAYPYVPELGTIEADLELDARQYLKEVRSGLPAALTTEMAVLRGAPTVVLADYLREEGIDLVVMTTHGRGGFRRLALGSTADRLVRLGLPVLLIGVAEQHP